MAAPCDVPQNLSELDSFLADHEATYDLKAGTEAHIEWQPNSKHQQTEYALVYLHGFRASHPEGHPVHREIADFLGANLYLSRLQEHGIKSNYPLIDLTENKLLESARLALTIGQKIGKKVLIMGCSTGGSLALYLAAQADDRHNIAGLILYSPLIQFYGLKGKLLQHPFSRTLLKRLIPSSYLITTSEVSQAESKIWNSSYALRGALALGAFVEHQMRSELFGKVRCPVFTGYYYKDSNNQDNTVSVPAIQRMLTMLGTPTAQVHSANFPEAKNHVICSSLLSKSTKEVISETKNFLKYVGMQKDRTTP
ncbi:alpha/beta hydrolase [Fodinibius salsisoli]|uniref:Alpha/beta hydrolase n=1 Tax=Fodinibius salsisoli TaxID=2820877 RepID=A0ABT3PH46_9BACT|nr:YqiA/YcfP family alpha/beta fold hydrolase [Fodinibius salsisoli]MCW9705243.1 alpha/beta hydrolase [Fodinibius salsisoli]